MKTCPLETGISQSGIRKMEMAHMRVAITRSNPNQVYKEKFAEIAEHTNLFKMPEPAEPMNFFFSNKNTES